MTDVLDGAVSLLKDNSEARLAADVIDMFGNYAQFMGLIDRIRYHHNMQVSISPDEVGMLSVAVGGVNLTQLNNGILAPTGDILISLEQDLGMEGEK